jgi:hypothetical protein
MKIKEIILEAVYEGEGITLGQLCKVGTNFSDADFWLQRKGSIDTVGKVVKDYEPENIGIKVEFPDTLDPKYLYYMMMNIHNKGHWKSLAHGTLRLVNIKTSDVKNLRIQ